MFELVEENAATETLYGSEDPAVSLPTVIEHVRSGRLGLGAALGPSFALDDLNEAVAARLAGEAGRVIVRP